MTVCWIDVSKLPTYTTCFVCGTHGCSYDYVLSGQGVAHLGNPAFKPDLWHVVWFWTLKVLGTYETMRSPSEQLTCSTRRVSRSQLTAVSCLFSGGHAILPAKDHR
jgi:hypothetical protein